MFTLWPSEHEKECDESFGIKGNSCVTCYACSNSGHYSENCEFKTDRCNPSKK